MRSVSPLSVRKAGVVVLPASVTGAKAVTTKDSGEIMALSSPCSSHTVFIDKESLPTGIAIPNAGHNSIPTALTVSYNAASSPGWPQAAIQLADSLISPMLAILAAAIFVIASPTAIRPDAGASINANGARSPIAMASPCTP